MLNPLSLLREVISIAESAGRLVMDIYQRDFAVEQKEDRTPLTEADMASHHHITQALTALTPSMPVLSEESAEIPYEERRLWQQYWLVDPLDGTKEFVHRNGEFTVNIALIHNGKPVLGVVLAPAQAVTYYAVSGSGAFRSRATASVGTRICARRQLPAVPTVISSRSHPSDRLQMFLNNLGTFEKLKLGSSMKSCRVAEGEADIYPRFGLTGEWDTAAAQVIVEEAGGMLVDTALQPLKYNTKSSLLNPDFLVVGDRGYEWGQLLP